MESKETLAAGRITPDLHIKGQFLGTELLPVLELQGRKLHLCAHLRGALSSLVVNGTKPVT